MSYKVGLNLVEGLGGAVPVEGAATGVTGLIGTFLKGPLNVATPCYSWAHFQSLFGYAPAPGTTSYYSVKAFFQNAPSGVLHVVRVAASAAAKATLTCNDRNSSPASTLRIDANSQGAWGNNISAAITDSNILTTTLAADVSASAVSALLTSTGGLEVGSDIHFHDATHDEYRRLNQVDHATGRVYWATGTGLTNAFTAATATITSMEFAIVIYYSGVAIKTYSGLSMNNDVSFFCEKMVVDDAYITVTDLKSVNTDYKDLPVVAAVAALTSGADGLSGVVASDYVGVQASKSGMYAFDNVSNLFRFCCPNPKLTDQAPTTAYASLVQSLLTYANNRPMPAEFYGDIPYGTSVTNSVIFAGNYEGRLLTLFWPWLKVVENGINIWLPPSSFVLGVAVNKDDRRGVHKNVGNESISYAYDLEYQVSGTEGEALNDVGVNTIRRFAGRGILTYGGRTRSAETKWRFLNWSEYANYLGSSLMNAMWDVPFEVNNAQLWSRTRQRVSEFLATEQQKGALFNPLNPGAPAYTVVIDGSNNTGATIAAGEFFIAFTYTPAGVAEKVIVAMTHDPSGGWLLSIA